MPEGAYLGSEESLAKQFQVSGPTLRQATRLLEHEETLKVRRGVKGGFYSSRPRLETVSRVSAIFLRGNVQNYDEVLQFIVHQMPFLVDRLLESDRLPELEPFAQEPSPTMSHREFVDRQTRITNLMWEIAGNAPLRLFGAIFLQVGLSVPVSDSRLDLRETFELSDGSRQVQQLRTDLIRALLAGDRARATELAIEQCRMVHEGLKALLTESSLAPQPASTSE